jgi:hypothetical protein
MISELHAWTGMGIFELCFHAQVKAVITVLVASYSAYEGHNNARKAETEDYRRLNTGKL